MKDLHALTPYSRSNRRPGRRGPRLAAAPRRARRATGPAERRRRGDALARKLVKDASAKDAYKHLKALQAIADANGGNRAAGTPGHEQSAEYVTTC